MRVFCLRQRGFALIVSMLILLVLTILVINAVRNTSLNEKMAGNYMDRTRAQQAAEQALRQAEALLVANGDTCVTGCAVNAGAVVASSVHVTAMPSTWSDAGATTMALATDQHTSGKFLVAQLADVFLPAGKAGCKAYSLIGRGQGFDSRAVVVLQTVAFVCSV